MRTIRTAHVDLASLNPVDERVKVHLANGWAGDLRSVSYDNNLQEFTLDMSGFVQKYNRGGMHWKHPFLNVVSLTIEVQDVPAVKPGLWARMSAYVGRCISIPIDFSGEKQGGLVPKGINNRKVYVERVEDNVQKVKVEFPYSGLINPDVFAIKEGVHPSSRGKPVQDLSCINIGGKRKQKAFWGNSNDK